MSIHGLCAMPKLKQTNLALQHQHAKGWTRSPIHQECGVWDLVLPWRHQALCELHQEVFNNEHAYGTQYVAYEDRYQPIKGGGVDGQGCK